MKERIYLLEARHKPELGAIRCLPGLKAAESAGLIWIRGIEASADTDIRLRVLPAKVRYNLLTGNYLAPEGKTTPVAVLPDLNWVTINEFVPVQLPVSALPGHSQGLCPVKLSHSDIPKEEAGILTDLDTLKQYAETAPAIRLESTQMAVSETNEVLVLGTPLLPVPGRQLWQIGNILLPAGYDFDPPLLAKLLDSRLNPADDHFLLFREDGTWERIPKTVFVTTSRSGIRLT